MSPRPARGLLFRLFAFATLTAAAALAAPVQAALSSPVSVSLIAPGGPSYPEAPLPVTDVVDPAVGISVGDTTVIGGLYMLPGESIVFSDHSILLHVAAGAEDGADLVTGFLSNGADRARYEFSNLSFAGERIVGANVLALNGVISGTGGGLGPDGHVSFFLDELKFIDPGTGTSNAFGEFRIDLVTTPVPEPAAWALMFAGLALVARRAQVARREA